MSELSNRQKRYLLLQKRHHLIVNLSRLLILILFLGLWESLPRLEMIDSFVFSMSCQDCPLLLEHGP